MSIIEDVEHIANCCGEGTNWKRILLDAAALLRTHPDNQPNRPLTLEELREMDGQPVWIDRGPGYGVGWVLVQVWAKSTNIIYLIQANGSVLQLGVEIENGAKLYRRPPKGAET